jgi:predicted RNase H-like HicB family nuclease
VRAQVEYHVTIHEEDGAYWAEVAELPGCFASGDNLDELREALFEAIRVYLTLEAPAPDNGGAAPLRVGGMTLVTA